MELEGDLFLLSGKKFIDSDKDDPIGAITAQEGEIFAQNWNNSQGNHHHHSRPSQ